MKKFPSKIIKIRIFFAPIVLFVVCILYLTQNIKAQSALDGFDPT